MADEKVTFVLSARDNASRTINKLKGELGMMGGTAAKTAGPLGKLSALTGGMVSPMGLAVGATVGLGAAFLSTAQGASDLAEEVDKSKVVFGPVSDEMVRFAEGASEIGLSTKAALGAAGAFGNMFNTVGIAQEASQDMSETMVQLAADMGSFNNVDPAEMLDKLRSGLSGEAEPLRKFGVLLSEASVKAFAMQNGIGEAGRALTEAEKVTARYGLILEQTAIQQGNFADTSEGLANSQRRWNAVLENASDEVGKLAASIVLGFMKIVEFLGTEVSPWELVADRWNQDFGGILEQVDGFVFGVKEKVNSMPSDMQIAALAAVRAVEEEYVKGLPVVAAEAGKIAGLLPSEIRARDAEIRAAGRENVVQFAAGVLEAQNSPRTAIDAMNRANAEALDRGAEIAQLKGWLTGDKLAAGLNDRRPAVRLAAQAARAEITARLETLGVDASRWGANIGSSLAGGLNSQYGVVRDAAGNLAGAVRGQIGIRSEPEDASSPLRGITQWGGNIVKTLASDIRGNLGVARNAAGALGGALVPSMGGAMTPAYAGGGMGGQVNVTINPPSTWSPAEGQRFAREAVPEMAREMRRQRLIP